MKTSRRHLADFTEKRAARAARLFFFIHPIKSVVVVLSLLHVVVVHDFWLVHNVQPEQHTFIVNHFSYSLRFSDVTLFFVTPCCFLTSLFFLTRRQLLLMLPITKKTTTREISTFELSREKVNLYSEEGNQEERNRILAKTVSNWNYVIWSRKMEMEGIPVNR